jgi:hypothetical protein
VARLQCARGSARASCQPAADTAPAAVALALLRACRAPRACAPLGLHRRAQAPTWPCKRCARRAAHDARFDLTRCACANVPMCQCANLCLSPCAGATRATRAMHASRVRAHLVLLVLWTAGVAVAAQPPPPLSVASIQAQLAALKAQLPPNCVGSSFLQRTATGWACVAPVSDLSATGWCRAAPGGGGVTCDAAPPLAAPPRCLPPGGSWLGFNSSAGGWVCVCKPGWAGRTCTTPTTNVSVSCGPPPPCASGLYNLVAGVFSCVAGSQVFSCTQQDATCSALGDLYYATNGAGWTTKTGWASASAGTSTDYCTFSGVTCNRGAVVEMCVSFFAAPSATLFY